LLDTRLSFREHLAYVSEKASHTARALSRILLNTRGPKQWKRKLLSNVVTSQLLYAAPVWAEASRVRSYMRGAEATYRLCALRVACAFRTVSDDAALVIAGLVPLGELAQEARETRLTRADPGSTSREARRAARRRSIIRWQAMWDSSTKGRWTHRLIPDISSWVNRRHGEVDFYLTQVLSGHGCFRSYLKRFGHEDED
ncbi:hypothetical protein KR032_009296, partial [Drosophila birchii]